MRLFIIINKKNGVQSVGIWGCGPLTFGERSYGYFWRASNEQIWLWPYLWRLSGWYWGVVMSAHWCKKKVKQTELHFNIMDWMQHLTLRFTIRIKLFQPPNTFDVLDAGQYGWYVVQTYGGIPKRQNIHGHLLFAPPPPPSISSRRISCISISHDMINMVTAGDNYHKLMTYGTRSTT